MAGTDPDCSKIILYYRGRLAIDHDAYLRKNVISGNNFFLFVVLTSTWLRGARHSHPSHRIASTSLEDLSISSSDHIGVITTLSNSKIPRINNQPRHSFAGFDHLGFRLCGRAKRR